MACSGCCRCCHEPPHDVHARTAEVAERLAAAMNTKPYYSRMGRYRTLVYPHGNARSVDLPTIAGRVRVEVVHIDNDPIVSLDFYGLAPGVAVTLLEMMFTPAKPKIRRKRKGRRS